MARVGFMVKAAFKQRHEGGKLAMWESGGSMSQA